MYYDSSEIKPKPISDYKNLLVTKHNFMKYKNQKNPNDVIPYHKPSDIEVAQANLFNFFNVSIPTSTEITNNFENSIEYPEYTAFEVTRPTTYANKNFKKPRPNYIYESYNYHNSEKPNNFYKPNQTKPIQPPIYYNAEPNLAQHKPVTHVQHTNIDNDKNNIKLNCQNGAEYERILLNCQPFIENPIINTLIKPSIQFQTVTTPFTTTSNKTITKTKNKTNESTKQQLQSNEILSGEDLSSEEVPAPVIYIKYPNMKTKIKKKRRKTKIKKKTKKRRRRRPLFYDDDYEDVQKVKYTDPPIVVAVEHALDNVYNFFEDAFTDSVQYPETVEFEVIDNDNDIDNVGDPPIMHKVTKKKTGNKINNVKTQIPYSNYDYSLEAYPNRYNTGYYTEYEASDEERTIPTTKKSSQNPKKKIKAQKLKSTTPMSKPYKKLNKNNMKKSTLSHKKKITTRSINLTNKSKVNDEYPTTQPTIFLKHKKNPIEKDKNKKLVTQIHVTSEYIAPTTTLKPLITKPKRKKYRSKQNYKSDEYYDDFFGMSFPIDDEDNDDEDNESNSDLSYDTSENASDSSKSKKKVTTNQKGSNKTSKYESFEDYSDERDYSDDLYTYISSIGNSLSSINEKVPLLLTNDDYSEEHGRSTTPKINHKTPKYVLPSYLQNNSIENSNENNSIEEIEDYSSLWVPDNSDENSDEQRPNWIQSWFYNKDTNLDSPIITTTEAPNTGWWNSWFSYDNDNPDLLTTSTTIAPKPHPLQKPVTFINQLKNSNKDSEATNGNISQRKSYSNYKLLRIIPESTEDVKTLESYRTSMEHSELQWWKGPTLRGPTDLLVPPNMTEIVKEFLEDEEIKFETIISDLQKAIMYENPKLSKKELLEIQLRQKHPLTWSKYHSYQDIIKFLEYLQRKYPKNVELIYIGRSYEGRPLVITKIFIDEIEIDNSKMKYNKGYMRYPSKKKKKPGVFIEAGVHGREWISPAVATWILKNLVKNIFGNDTQSESLKSVDWYIMPLVNPDGYEYSRNYDRLWRKTRSKHKDNDKYGLLSSAYKWMHYGYDSEQHCYGVDPNRNWDINWNGDGSSTSKCSDYYIGPEIFSEQETKALSKFILEYRKHLNIFLSLHSYGQFITYPRAEKSLQTQHIDDEMDMILVAIESLRNIDRTSRYRIDSSNDMIFARTGSSDYFAKYKAGIKYCFTVELRDTGTHGFLLPSSYIEGTASDTFEMIKTMVDYL